MASNNRSMRKAGISILLTLCMLISALPQISRENNSTVAAADGNVAVTSGAAVSTKQPAITAKPRPSQTVPEGYKPVYDIGDLYSIRDDLSANYILMNDIDMSVDTAEGGDYDRGNGWEPIQNFKGDFDGNGYRILGMHIFGDTGDKRVGLFGSTSGTIKNLGMIDCDIDIDCSGSDNEHRYVGGIAGRGKDLEECYVTGRIQVKDFCDTDRWDYRTIGGIIGDTSGKSISKCYSTVDIKVTGKDGESLSGCIAGIAGYSWNTDLSQCYYAGKNWREYAFSGKTCSSCYYMSGPAEQGYPYADNSSGVVKLTETQMKNQRMFTGFDFDNIWEIDPYCAGYQYPQLKKNRQVRAVQIDITKLPEKTVYEQCDTPDFADGQIKIYYEDKTQAEIMLTNDMTSGYDLNEIGDQTVTIHYAGCTTEFPIKVNGVAVKELTLDKKELSINVLDKAQLTAAITPGNASNKNLIWESSDESVATVDEKGLVTGITKGKTEVTVYSYNREKSASCTVNVLVPSKQITISESSVELKKGEEIKLTAKLQPLNTTDLVKWSTSNAKVATVDEDGKVTAVGGGTVEITATADSGISAVCKMKVLVSSKEITLSQETAELKKGDILELTAGLQPLDATDTVRWSSSDSQIATVDQNGKVTAVGGGTVDIIATADSGISAKCEVNVLVPSTGVTLSENSIKLKKGGTEDLTADLSPWDTTDSIKWSTGNAEVATVDEDGKVTAVGGGTVDITATADSGVSAVCKVIVEIPAESVSLSEKQKTVEVGTTFTLSAAMSPADSTDQVSWSYSNVWDENDDNSIDDIDDLDDAEFVKDMKNGTYKACECGTVKVTVSTDSGCTDQCMIKIVKKGTLATATPLPTSSASTGDDYESPGTVIFQKNEIVLEIEQEYVLEPTVYPAELEYSLKWSSDNKKVATVSSTGVVKGIGAGQANISVSAKGKVLAIVSVTVKKTKNGIMRKTKKKLNGIHIKIKSIKKITKKSAVLQLSGNGIGKAESYQIKVTQKGKKSIIKEMDPAKIYRLTKLKRKKKYTVKIRPVEYLYDYDTFCYGSWSSAKSFKTK